MRVFVSWSGARSKAVAEVLASWLSQVIQATDPWVSTDIAKGVRWGSEIQQRLAESKVGIVCLTADNLDSTWLHFEAGAIGRSQDAHVCTFLFDVKHAQVKEPLSQFQHTSNDKDDVKQLLRSINGAVERAGERALPEATLEKVFEQNWPSLLADLERVKSMEAPAASRKRPAEDLLEELLTIVRRQQFEGIERLLASSYPSPVFESRIFPKGGVAFLPIGEDGAMEPANINPGGQGFVPITVTAWGNILIIPQERERSAES